MPNFERMNIEKAKELADDTGLILNISTQHNSEVPKDVIINQTTPEGMMVRKGFEVKVIVSEGSKLVTVPDLSKVDVTDVERTLKDAGLEVGYAKEEPSDYPIGTIIDQSPNAGIEVAPRSKVDYIVSTGPAVATFPMPTLVGKTLQEAQDLIKQYKLEAVISEKYSDVYVRGHVMEQSINPNKDVIEGSVVNLVVSKGSDVPDQMEEIEEENNENQEESSSSSVTKTITINLEKYTGKVDVEVYQINDSKSKKVYSEKHNLDKEENSIRVEVMGTGYQQYAVYVDGEYHGIAPVNF